MNWINELNSLYENNEAIAGKIKKVVKKGKKEGEESTLILLPPFHTTMAAQITITINDEGEFYRAEAVPAEDKLTVIPVTENSASRTARDYPHPFCDKLRYLSGNYMSYYRQSEEDIEKGKEKDYSDRYIDYMKQLSDWKNSEYTHPKVMALYKYLSRNTIIKDLVNSRVILMEDGLFKEGEKIQGIDSQEAFVRFRILSKLVNIENETEVPECWLDKSLQNSYIDYYISTLQERNFCYLTGDNVPITYLQPKKIRHEGDGAKLISCNDSENFTYRGRFKDKEEAFSVGYMTSQKIQNALKWIIRKQGMFVDELCIVMWESNLQDIPKWNVDTDRIIDDYGWNDDYDGEHDSETGESVAAKFNSAMRGYTTKLGNTSRVVILALEAATSGRLAIVDNKVFDTARYIENIQYWHNTCFWSQTKLKDGKSYHFYGMQGISELVTCICGREENGSMVVNDNQFASSLNKRLLPCIYGKKPIPIDIVRNITNKASMPQSYDKRYNWEQVLSIACSLVKKYYFENKKEEWTVSLNKESKDRNYLYGRLLAVADRIEYRTYTEEDSKRVTNAMRYMTTFSQHPYQTWRLIEERIQPYLEKLNIKERLYYKKVLEEINDLFDEESFCDNRKLEGLYLNGYHCQSSDFKNRKEEEK
ncbi:MAG: type I-C CRISPR-associated protein Cas8c/Csd1 [Suipraeoptans sp.]